ncbi:uncharacterized protein LOC130433119 [Triplophysa dalaica]|uniref:uncharacterized protein LOC130415960 n=1 Tax=Triplophysa dalaica TaxID=1582913 RepID=UPI0024DFDD6F|nr:uncharacterized protein LOC130415960 [Triplophysa dalaica]XP_056606324.1 uncharacterized protein LOC130424568 [Triplophysa dalaica]XP_056618807.1 uncharacterized protein LOC130433119 [Triplophysa dalaica]
MSNNERLLQGEQMETSQTELETIQEVEKGSTSAPSKKEPRKSSRERKLTEKMLELKQQEISQKEIKWIKLYESWKDQAKDTRVKIKDECSEEDLSKMMDAVEGLETQVKEMYETIRSQTAPSTEIRRKMDSCTAVTADLMRLLKVRMCEVGLEEFDATGENARIHMVLDKEYANSIFGSTKSKHTVQSSHSKCSSENLSIAAKRAECAAQLAAKQAEIKMEEAIAAQKQELKRLENQRDLQVIAAKLKAYSEADSSDESRTTGSEVANSPIYSPKEMKKEQTFINIDKVQPNQSNDDGSLAQALHDAMVLTRLPAPEPSVFTGDPLTFLEWSSSFKALIERRCTNPVDRLFYLKKYISGEAKCVLEGSFFRKDDKAYEQAWELLNSRYGHPFVIQRAFREKLNNWPKISSRESVKLRQFSDFLISCNNAIPHIKGLQVLNDCEENQRMVQKLPDWVTSQWNRYVTKHLRETEEYPKFNEFAEFVAREAEVACNPVTSFNALKSTEERPIRDVKRQRANAFITNVKAPDKFCTVMRSNSAGENQPKESNKVNVTSPFSEPVPCLCCGDSHSIHKCQTFANKPVEEKKRLIFDNNLCFGCLRRGHNSRECRSKAICSICKKRHPTPLHEERSSAAADTSSHAIETEETTSSLSCSVDRGCGGSTSMIVPVWISSSTNPEKQILVYALLDTQSSNTFVDKEVCEEIGASLEPVKLKLTTMMGKDSIIQSERVNGLRVKGLLSQSLVNLPPAYTRDFIPLERSHIPTSQTAKRWNHLNSIVQEMPKLMDCKVGLLIGYDCSRALAPRQVITGGEDEPYAIKTDLGWSIVGSSPKVAKSTEVIGLCHRVHVKEVPPLTPATIIRALESDFKDTNPGERSMSQDDIQFMQLLNEKTNYNADGHLEMPLPFRTRPHLPENKRLALARLKRLKGKLEKNPKFKEDYVKFMGGVFKDGDAERAEQQSETGNVWYIPHQGVYHPKKPNKIRVVFDCSAKYDGTALNDHLLVGPDLTNGLTGVLCRFRKYPIAVICDVEKMFHRFHVSQEDRDYLRFLWWENGDTNSEPKEYRMKVHLFGAASSPGCANYGMKHLANQNEKDYPAAANFIRKNFYVDDGLVSVEDVDTAINLVREAQTVCAKGRLHLHKFISNNREVLESIPDNERATEMHDVDLRHDDLPVQTVLGVKWSANSDTFSFKVILDEKPATRRGILSTIASVFDPLGFLAPFLLLGKKILQDMCRKGIEWDEPLPEELKPRWESWLNDLKNLQGLQIPRCITSGKMETTQRIELHHFSDASSQGYGQCSYIRLLSEDKVHCSLVIGKARVAPTKVVTIPRLELSAAVVSSAVSSMLREELELKIDQEYFWTDSKVVLGYINNEARRFHVFVANRVQRIRETSDPAQWYYVDSDSNPADHASRGLSVSELISSNWFTGPKFLWEREIVTSESDPELLVGDPEVKVTQVLQTKLEKEEQFLDRFSRFSKWHTALKVVARIQQLAKGNKFPKPINVEDLKKAGVALIKLAQKDAFEKEMETLSHGKLPNNNQFFQLDPVLHDGVLRVGGRLTKASSPLDLKHPIILPKNGSVTRLILGHCHEKTQHQGRGQTLNELRANGYWIVGGSKVVANYIKQCVTCRRARRPTETQKMADLPANRVDPSPPFSYCGMDCFGPFHTKQGRKEYKRYGLIFTCLSSRAIHVEMLEDLTTDAFINALRSFIAIRGAVREIRSDQGTNFIGAKNELTKALNELDKERLTAYLAQKQCDFTFNVPDASHMGGIWERQIRTIRSVLNWVLSQSAGRLDDASLRTFLYEAMSIINCRPLTTDTINDPKSLEPLTPNHLLTMKASVPLPPPGKFEAEDLYSKKRWRRVQYLTEQFWGRWKREYLANIALRQRWHSAKRNVKIGDVVILQEDALPRNGWRLGRVLDVRTDEDGLVRKVTIQLGDRKASKEGKSKNNNFSILERPIHKLVVLVENN